MKNTSLLIAIPIFILACNSSSLQKATNEEPKSAQTAQSQKTDTDSIIEKFNIEEIPFSKSELGSFPFFSLPKGLESQNKPFQRNFDLCYFPVAGVMTPFEGKLYKIFVVGDGTEPFSKRYFEKSLETYLLSIGAVKIFDGEITQEEYNRYNKQDPNKGDDGDIGYADENIKFYVIRSKADGHIYVQFSANQISGKLNILQEAALQKTVVKITSDEIVRDLSETGKSILYLNFDLDKAILTKEGAEVVNQITLALKKDSALKISIEGHTDNKGELIYNKKLSVARAEAVMNALVSAGIQKSRLSVRGFGAEQPLVANDSEENSAKNRRVELLKVNGGG